MESKRLQILLVEDNPGDVWLTKEVFKHAKLANTLHVVEDGEEAMDFLRRQTHYGHAPRPDLILLDLGLPRKNGSAVLAEIKQDEDLRCIPVVVITSSQDRFEIRRVYNLYANCCICKPTDPDYFFAVMRSIEDFWLTTVRLPAP